MTNTQTLAAEKPNALSTLLELAHGKPDEAAIRCHRVPGVHYQLHYLANEKATAALTSIGVKWEKAGSSSSLVTRHARRSEKFPIRVDRESINEALGKEGDAFYIAVREPEKAVRVVG